MGISLTIHQNKDTLISVLTETILCMFLNSKNSNRLTLIENDIWLYTSGT